MYIECENVDCIAREEHIRTRRLHMRCTDWRTFKCGEMLWSAETPWIEQLSAMWATGDDRNCKACPPLRYGVVHFEPADGIHAVASVVTY